VADNDTALVLLFANDAQLDLLRTASLVYIDFTFRVVPTLFYQLFTVFVSYAEHTFHVCFALMTRKTAALYQAVLQKVHELVPQFQPTQVIADFQEAPLLPSVLCSGTMLQCKAVGFTLRERLLKVYAYWACRTHIRTTHIRMTVFRCLLSLPLLPVGDIICPHLTRSVLCWTTSCRLSH